MAPSLLRLQAGCAPPLDYKLECFQFGRNRARACRQQRPLMADTVDKLGAIHCQGNTGIVGASNTNHCFAYSRFHESILRLRPLKIVYQQYRLQAEMPKSACLRPVLALKPTSAPRR